MLNGIIVKTIFILMLMISISVEAKLYKWVDENGETHFSQTPPRDISQDYEARDISSSPKMDPQCCTEVRKIVQEMSQLLKSGVPLTELHLLVRSEYKVELTELANFASERTLMGYTASQTSAYSYSVCMNARFSACRQTSNVTQGKESSGSGFWITQDTVLTNAHVVDGCKTISVGRKGKGDIKHTDAFRDLALLHVTGERGAPVNFRSTSKIFQGETVVAAGFPLSGILAEDLNVTQGIVSALAGVKGDKRYFQITAPIQPGNSGGPLYDKKGSVIGIVTAKLNALRLAERTGDIAQNINFAIKIGEIKRYLNDRAMPFHEASSDTAVISTEEISTYARAEVITIRCKK